MIFSKSVLLLDLIKLILSRTLIHHLIKIYSRIWVLVLLLLATHCRCIPRWYHINIRRSRMYIFPLHFLELRIVLHHNLSLIFQSFSLLFEDSLFGIGTCHEEILDLRWELGRFTYVYWWDKISIMVLWYFVGSEREIIIGVLELLLTVLKIGFLAILIVKIELVLTERLGLKTLIEMTLR